MRTLVTVFTLIVCAVAVLPHTILAQSKNPRNPISQSGSIDFEEEVRREDPYSVTQDKTIAFVESVLASARALASGGTANFSEVPGDAIIHFLTASYLYCSSKLGVCPFLIDTLYEYDLVTSRTNGNAACPSTLRFWELWIASDMEKRSQFLTKLGHMDIVDDFRKNKRARYVRCAASIGETLKAGANDSQFYKTRYSEQGELIAALKKAILVLKEIKEKIPNIFAAVGVSRASTAAESGKSGPKK